MPKPRKLQISLDTTPYYHCTSRCVRRAFLCGADTLTGQSYEHRRQWVEDRLLFLGTCFCIDVCAYAVMSNHHHLVLFVNKAESLKLTDAEVCQRWHRLYKGTELTRKFEQGKPLDQAERDAVQLKLDLWRLQLCDISWFMRALNEPIARQANAEDKVTGAFWESRFKSQALLDEKALAAAMAYVDLNPIRAKLANTPESSDHTSIKKRIHALKTDDDASKTTNRVGQPLQLAKFVGNPQEDMPVGLPFDLKDYIALVDVTGRAIREDKRGYIDHALPPILERLDISPKSWMLLTREFEARFKTFVGSSETIQKAKTQMGYQRGSGMRENRMMFG